MQVWLKGEGCRCEIEAGVEVHRILRRWVWWQTLTYLVSVNQCLQARHLEWFKVCVCNLGI